MSSGLERLSRPGGPLSAEPFDSSEFDGLRRAAAARLNDAKNPQLALESRFDLAYNAAHAYCLAALRRLGYRAGVRYIVFQVLPDTLNLGPAVWRVLAKAHEQRNLAEYQGELDINERFVEDLINACTTVSTALEGAATPSP